MLNCSTKIMRSLEKDEVINSWGGFITFNFMYNVTGVVWVTQKDKMNFMHAVHGRYK